MSLLGSSMVFLAAAVVAVPIFKRFKLGAILGYLVAGAAIGPSVMDWINEPDTILHFAELGVVLLLFVIGLELEPKKLWKMRSDILFTGAGQLIISAIAISILVFSFSNQTSVAAITIGLALALSSTAFAIQLMTEQGILRTPPGQKGFAVLLMQDLAVIPILLMVQSLSTAASVEGPAWYISIAAIAAVLVIGRYMINPLLRVVSDHGSAEIMTACALLIVIATAVGMQEAGLSMGMGAFIAGILLANSSFKHQLETEIEPFKGLLLGLFFMAIGMNLDLQLFIDQPLFIVGAAVLLVLIKGLVIFALLKFAKQSNTDSVRIALMLSQGGEFAFVVMTQAASGGIVDPIVASQITLIVGVSMALTSPLVILHSLWFNSLNCPAVYDSQRDTQEPSVIIAGFGRFGQISARILAANGIPFTALDKDAEQIEFVRKFGNKIFYGDATRLDLLKVAGIEHAKVLLIAVDNEADTLKISALAAQHFSHVKVIARARNRTTVIALSHHKNVRAVREMFHSGLVAAEQLLQEYGYSESQARLLCSTFEQHDEGLLTRAVEQNMDMPTLIKTSQQGRQELASLFAKDKDTT